MSSTKNDSLVKCDKCFDTIYIVDINVNGTIHICTCDDCISKNAYQKDVILQAKIKCKVINDKSLDPDNKTKFNSYLKSLDDKKEFENIIRALNLFIERYPVIKRKTKHLEILKNPHNFRIVRPIEPHQFTAIHLFARNQIFQIISTKSRAKKTRVDEFGKIIDISEDRSFLGWGGNIHFTISGPVLCDQDQSVFDACIKLWHEKHQTGIILETNLSEIWKTIGNNSVIGKKNREAIRRSLSRLQKVSIEAKSMDKYNKSFWGEGIVDRIQYKDTTENKVIVTLNLHMAASYLQGSYATLNHDVYKVLSAYSKKIYLFLMSHENPIRQISLEKLRLLIGVDDTVSNHHFKKYVNRSLIELQNNNVLDHLSKIKNEIFYTIVKKEAWDARPTPNTTLQFL